MGLGKKLKKAVKHVAHAFRDVGKGLEDFGQGTANAVTLGKKRKGRIMKEKASRAAEAQRAEMEKQQAIALDERKRKINQRRAQLNFGYTPTGGYTSAGIIGTPGDKIG